MPRKKNPAQLLLLPKNQSTQCDFYLKPTSTKQIQHDNSEFMFNASTETEEVMNIKDTLKTKDVSTDTLDFEPLRVESTVSKVITKIPLEVAGECLLVNHKYTQCDFFIKTKCSRESQTENVEGLPLIERLAHENHKRKHHCLELEFQSCPENVKRMKNSENSLSVAEPLVVTNVQNLTGYLIPSKPREKAILAIEDYIRNLKPSGVNINQMKNRERNLIQIEVKRDDTLRLSDNYFSSPVKLIFSTNGIVTTWTLFKTPALKVVFDPNSETIDVNWNIVQEAHLELGDCWVFCPGISENGRELKYFGTKNLQIIKYPFKRLQSNDCLVWHVPPTNVNKDNYKDGMYQCGKCRYLNRYILKQKKKKDSVTPRTKLKRLSVTSRCRISVLTPKSRSKRYKENKQNRATLNRKIKQLESKIIQSSIRLNDTQHRNMQDVVSEINSKGQNDLNKIFKEASDKNKMLGEALKASWKLDSSRNTFQRNQEKCEKGHTGNRWSPLTYRVALSVYSRSPAAYEALSSFDIIKLPSVHTLRNKLRQNPSKQGIDLVYLKCEADNFKKYADGYAENFKPPPKGALIFDEVKVIGKLVWNSRNNEFVGCALTPHEFPSLEDLYKENTMSETLEAEYVLQFLWRCVAGKFDVLGPYFMLSKPASHSFIADLLFKVIWAFQSVGLETICLVCDGGTSNVGALRHTLGMSTLFGYAEKDDGCYDFSFKPKFAHPFLKDRWIHWVICPTHQLKNMINALHHSQVNGSRDFAIMGDVRFGWNQIIDLYAREVDRRDNNELAQVKGLTLSHIERDSWTKLSVFPAKILQDNKTLGELYNYANPKYESPPNDRDSVMACHDYLYACNQLFENGLLSHDKVNSMDSAPINSMRKGLEYFECWATEIIMCEESLNKQTTIKSNGSRISGNRFLAWQTWELLRICVYGFYGLSEDFLSRHPAKWIAPVRINGSAVETVFSQLKYIAGGKITSLNYSPGIRALLIKNCTKTSQNAEQVYRKVNLDLFQEY